MIGLNLSTVKSDLVVSMSVLLYNHSSGMIQIQMYHDQHDI